MIKIVKNVGQCPSLIGDSKFLLYLYDKDIGDLYAKLGLKPILGCIIYKILYHSVKKKKEP